MATFDASRGEENSIRDRAYSVKGSSSSGDSDQQHPLDSEKAQDRLQELMRFRRQARAAHAENRREMAVDEDYYDSIQLTEEQLQILDEREQPVHIWNLCKNTCNWLIGTERRMRIDYNVLPRRKDHAQSAKAKKKAIKYVGDESRDSFVRSEAFADAIKSGVGWIEEAVRSDGSKEPIYCRKEDWRNVWFDHLSREIDYSDMRYLIREKWLDLDVAQAMFPDRAEALESLARGVNALYPYNPEDTILNDPATEFDIENDFDALTGGAYDGYRLRVKIIECWYRMPENVKVLRVSGENSPFGSIDDVIYREGDDYHEYLVRERYATLVDALRMTVRCAMWAGATYLQDEPSPYNHDRFPLTPIFCYRRKRDGMPYGIIRDIRSPQDAINADRFRSAALLASSKVIYEEGSINNPGEFYEEYQRPDGMCKVNAGALAQGKIKIVDGQQLATHHIEMVRESERFIQEISGVKDTLKGDTDRKLSGKAIGLLQNQGMVTSGIPFDNYYEAFQLCGEIRLSNIEQFMTGEKTLRITGQEKEEFLEVNKWNPQTGKMQNSITEAKHDFMVGKQDFRETLRQAAMVQFGEVLTALSQTGGKAAEVAFALLDIYVDMMDDLPNKEDAIARIRKINGQEPPDEDLSPEEKQVRDQARQAREAQEQQQKAIQEAMIQLEMRIKQAEAVSKEAEAASKQAKTFESTVSAAMKRLEGFMKALEVAGAIQLAPQLVEAADTIIEEAENAPLGGQNEQG